MGEWESFGKVLKQSKVSATILSATFLVTLVIDLVAGIVTGTVLSILFKNRSRINLEASKEAS